MNLTSFLLTVGSLISLGYSTAAQLNGNEVIIFKTRPHLFFAISFNSVHVFF